jgi:hypothetical protein
MHLYFEENINKKFQKAFTIQYTTKMPFEQKYASFFFFISSNNTTTN